MNVRNCRKCGRIFNYAMGPIICPQCREAQEAKFKEVKEYIQKHPGCGMQEVSRECDVETSQIQQWLREERLEFASDSMITLNCESCGTPIRSGRYCDKCKNDMTSSLRSVMQSNVVQKQMPVEHKKESPKMRFLEQ